MKNRKLSASFANAFRGIKQAFVTENNVKIHSFAAVCSVILGFVLKIELYDWMLVIFAITIVIVAELLNTAVEYAIDMVCGDNYHEIAKYAKDIAAGATLVAAIGALIIGAFVFLPYILELLHIL